MGERWASLSLLNTEITLVTKISSYFSAFYVQKHHSIDNHDLYLKASTWTKDEGSNEGIALTGGTVAEATGANVVKHERDTIESEGDKCILSYPTVVLTVKFPEAFTVNYRSTNTKQWQKGFPNTYTHKEKKKNFEGYAVNNMDTGMIFNSIKLKKGKRQRQSTALKVYLNF